MQYFDYKDKERVLEDARHTLKQEFVGIDNIIDQVIDNIKTWYVFPELFTRPLVMNLWGMTGCGKTSLVLRLIDLLELKNCCMYYNFAKLGEDASYDIEDNVLRTSPQSKKNPVFILDEFQFAATIAEDGKEKDNKSALKTFWELIDTGKFIFKLDINAIRNIARLKCCLEVMQIYGVRLENHALVNLNKLQAADNFDTGLVSQYFNYKGCDDYSGPDNRVWCDVTNEYIYNDKKEWLSCSALESLFSIYYSIIDNNTSFSEFRRYVLDLEYDDFYKLVCRLVKSSQSIYTVDYSQSLIFVLGNIDEAYTIAYDVDPDMDPDQFHEYTNNLTLVDIKEAMQRRFRNEQIARLGNLFMIYPAFSREDFMKIISNYLDAYRGRVKEKFDIDLIFDDSIIELVYKEGVFPTQGTRPIFSSIYEIVENKLTPIITRTLNRGWNSIDVIKYKYEGEKIVVEARKEECVETIYFDQTLKIESLRKITDKELQILTAVHESAHFITYILLFGKIPSQLVATSVNTHNNGFLLTDENNVKFYSRRDYIRCIAVDLAGWVMERVIFGEEGKSSGASNDLLKATIMASEMIQRCGMSNLLTPGVYTYSDEDSEGGMLIKNQLDNNVIQVQVKEILRECEHLVEELMENEEVRRVYKETVLYLKTHSSMKKDKMKELYDMLSDDIKIKYTRSSDFYETKTAEFLSDNF